MSQDLAASASPASVAAAPPTETIVVTAPRPNEIGSALTASEGVVGDQEIQLTPEFRPGSIFETVPGLSVTSHSGEGKANQYLLRGYNLDHGTDLETYIDGMPINQPTHAHGQGYIDLNFLIPELVNQITYTKGPYYADVGDFGAVGSVRANLRNTVDPQATLTVGTYNFERSLAMGSAPLGPGNVLAAVELQHYDGEFVVPDDQRKENAVLRYSQETANSSFSLTGMIYNNRSTNTTDIPERAISEGLVPNRYGSLDPTDGIRSSRDSISADYQVDMPNGHLDASAFYIHNELNIYNDFTHFLVDPVHGDQEDQFERRDVVGGQVNYFIPTSLAGVKNDFQFGALTRYDSIHVGRLPSQGQVALPLSVVSGDPASFSLDDNVGLVAVAGYGEVTTHWTSSFRTVLGVREDFQHGDDTDLLKNFHEGAGQFTDSGARGKGLFQPKGSAIYTVNDDLEVYASAGEGFHSADLRGVNQAFSPALGLPSTPLLARQIGEEIGVRTNFDKRLSATLSAYNLYQQSETIINPDVGMDAPGPPSERYGVELDLKYKITEWLDLDGNASVNHARFTHPFDDGTGHMGERITNAPNSAGSVNFYVHDLGNWSGGLTYRYLGNFPISSGACNNVAVRNDFPDVPNATCANAPTLKGQIFGKGYGEVNLDAHYALPDSGWIFSAGLFNLLNTHAPAAEFFYVDRLKNEIASLPDGRADIHEHPLEGFTARFSISKLF